MQSSQTDENTTSVIAWWSVAASFYTRTDVTNNATSLIFSLQFIIYEANVFWSDEINLTHSKEYKK